MCRNVVYLFILLLFILSSEFDYSRFVSACLLSDLVARWRAVARTSWIEMFIFLLFFVPFLFKISQNLTFYYTSYELRRLKPKTPEHRDDILDKISIVNSLSFSNLRITNGRHKKTKRGRRNKETELERKIKTITHPTIFKVFFHPRKMQSTI